MSDSVILTRHGHVAVLVLHDPPYNRLGMALFDRLETVVEELADDREVRVVVLRGGGDDNFSVGADIREFGAAAGERGVRDFIEQRHRVIRRIETLGKPVICAIRGACVGGGLEIALGCHLRIAARGAKIGLPEVELGVVPAWGGTQRLAHTVGRGRALDIMLRAKKLSAEEAYEAGLVNEVCEPDELQSRTMALAEELSEKAPIAIAGILDAVVVGAVKPLQEGLQHEYAALERTIASKDMQEGVMAFLQKRKPRFEGK